MPFTHVEIEERTTRHITLLFVFLVVLYAGSLLALLWGVKWFLQAPAPTPHPRAVTLSEALVVFGFSLAIAALHWAISMYRLFDRVLDTVMAQPADLRDAYHARFANIVQEVGVAVGGRPIEAYVIATPAVNACAAVDLSGRAAIAVTEGALAVLSRAQLEAVVGHEAAHVVRGDSLAVSVSCGLFALHEEAFKRLCGWFNVGAEEPTEEPEGMWRVETGGRFTGFLVLVMLVLWVTKGLRKCCEVLISREKEYRADAIAVRLTRDPLSLAEALQVLSERWRGVGTQGESLASIFIMDTGVEYFSEQEGWVAELFSTHPPTGRRIALLLGMAHVAPARFDEEAAARRVSTRARVMVPAAPPPLSAEEEVVARWLVWTNGQWSGPFGLEALARVGTLHPDTWVRRAESATTLPAHQDPQLLALLREQYARAEGAPAKAECPKCRVGLMTVRYEGAPIEQCPACRGCYADPDLLARLFVRLEYDFPESVKRWGDALLALERRGIFGRRFRSLPNQPKDWRCPRCHSAVLRKYYTNAYPVEVEQCWACGLTWFDRLELEVMQYLYEQKHKDE